MKNINAKDLVKSNAIWLVFIAEVIIFSIASGGTFITGNNIVNISRQVSYYGIASIGMTFVILIAGIDLSIGSIITLVNVVCAYLMVNAGMNMWVAVIISLLLATAIGTLNGGMVASIGIPALIATFASQTIFEGISYLISGGRPISGFTSDFGLFYFYAIGGNEEAAELSGIRVNRVKYLIYALSGFFAGLAGIVLLSRSGSAQSTVGKGLEFDVITCVVLGGVSVNGGVGRMSGVVAGVLIIGSLTNGMILMDVSEYTQMVVKGLVLAVAVGIDCMSKKHQAA